MSSKSTNPKDSISGNRIPYSCVPANVLAEVAVAMAEGAKKYGRHNYRVHGILASVYYNAAIGHQKSYWEGEDNDPDSDVHHVTKAIASLVVLRDAIMNNKCNDDRPPKSLPWKEGLMVKMEALSAKYLEGVDAYTQVAHACEAGTNVGGVVTGPLGVLPRKATEDALSLAEKYMMGANAAHVAIATLTRNETLTPACLDCEHYGDDNGVCGPCIDDLTRPRFVREPKAVEMSRFGYPLPPAGALSTPKTCNTCEHDKKGSNVCLDCGGFLRLNWEFKKPVVKEDSGV